MEKISRTIYLVQVVTTCYNVSLIGFKLSSVSEFAFHQLFSELYLRKFQNYSRILIEVNIYQFFLGVSFNCSCASGHRIAFSRKYVLSSVKIYDFIYIKKFRFRVKKSDTLPFLLQPRG